MQPPRAPHSPCSMRNRFVDAIWPDVLALSFAGAVFCRNGTMVPRVRARQVKDLPDRMMSHHRLRRAILKIAPFWQDRLRVTAARYRLFCLVPTEARGRDDWWRKARRCRKVTT